MEKTITIGKDRIYKAKGQWWVKGPGMKIAFLGRDQAIKYYCRNECNPIYNKVHYDCENCPIKNQKERRKR